jgi:hypothetical protein
MVFNFVSFDIVIPVVYFLGNDLSYIKHETVMCKMFLTSKHIDNIKTVFLAEDSNNMNFLEVSPPI